MLYNSIVYIHRDIYKRKHIFLESSQVEFGQIWRQIIFAYTLYYRECETLYLPTLPDFVVVVVVVVTFTNIVTNILLCITELLFCFQQQKSHQPLPALGTAGDRRVDWKKTTK